MEKKTAQLSSATAELLLNFWSWWYVEQWRNVLLKCSNVSARASRFTGFNVHSRLLFVPLYGDSSASGRIVGFAYRLLLSLLGAIVQLLVTFTLIIANLAYLTLPFWPLVRLWSVLI